ncbi:hypothetical protein [Ottowia thiooxydans]|uniref:hypothetical protein n=1 Tax=Ottowia thiooxydans TaxID=219182 RepID=UPI000423999F|nr:hypothetical protein [Ottowia thiooxydans]
MIPIDVSTVGLIVAVVTGVGSAWLGRRLSRGWRAKREIRQLQARRATESRQVRRARERQQKP